MGGKLILERGLTTVWRESDKLWIAADWSLSDDGESYRWANHREYPDGESALRDEEMLRSRNDE